MEEKSVYISESTGEEVAQFESSLQNILDNGISNTIILEQDGSSAYQSSLFFTV